MHGKLAWPTLLQRIISSSHKHKATILRQDHYSRRIAKNTPFRFPSGYSLRIPLKRLLSHGAANTISPSPIASPRGARVHRRNICNWEYPVVEKDSAATGEPWRLPPHVKNDRQRSPLAHPFLHFVPHPLRAGLPFIIRSSAYYSLFLAIFVPQGKVMRLREAWAHCVDGEKKKKITSYLERGRSNSTLFKAR